MAELVPKRIDDIMCLLEFATDRAQKGCMAEGAEIDMLWNVGEGLRGAWHAEMDDVRNKAEPRMMMTKLIDDFRRISSRIDEIALDFQAALTAADGRAKQAS